MVTTVAEGVLLRVETIIDETLLFLCFAMNGLWTMINDSKMEKMMFATGHIYRETGTASKYVEDRKYSQKIQEEANTKKSLQMIA